MFAQCAVLHTDMYGERKIRIMNYSWKATSKLINYFRSADVENVAQFKVRHDLTFVTKKGSKNVREKVINDMVTMLQNYRNLCAQ